MWKILGINCLTFHLFLVYLFNVTWMLFGMQLKVITCLNLEEIDAMGGDVVDEDKGAMVTRSWKRRHV